MSVFNIESHEKCFKKSISQILIFYNNIYRETSKINVSEETILYFLENERRILLLIFAKENACYEKL